MASPTPPSPATTWAGTSAANPREAHLHLGRGTGEMDVLVQTAGHGEERKGGQGGMGKGRMGKVTDREEDDGAERQLQRW